MNLKLYYHTLKHLKWQQIWYRLPIFKNIGRSLQAEPLDFSKAGLVDHWKPSVEGYRMYEGEWKFTFLNRSKTFSDEIDWDFTAYGLLWTYNLNYFEFLLHEDIDKEEGYLLIDNFIQRYDTIRVAHDPYPISLRLIFWIRFFINQKEQPSKKYLESLHLQAQELQGKLEYHLLANHLLENAFALFFTGVYLGDQKITQRAQKLLRRELDKQILSDGAHYELSPMYHQLMLYRLLDCVNLIQAASLNIEHSFVTYLHKTVSVMLGWMQTMTFANGDFPKLNDSANGIAPQPKALVEYAERLNIKTIIKPLKASGYRKWKGEEWEAFMDVGQIAPAYQPGHSHADNLNFVLYYQQKPIIVDTGISTYDKNERRQFERSTTAHNTVVVDNKNSSEVWGGFRVAKRATTTLEEETKNLIKAWHNGYRNFGIQHQRSFKKEAYSFIVEDKLIGTSKVKVQGFLHFHPAVKIRLLSEKVIVNEEFEILIKGAKDLTLQDYDYAAGYYDLRQAKFLVYSISPEEPVLLRISKKI